MIKSNATITAEGVLTYYDNASSETEISISRNEGVKAISKAFKTANAFNSLIVDGVKIEEEAFQNNRQINHVEIRNAIIGDKAFCYCSELSDVILDNVKIGHESFSRTDKANDIDLSKVKSLRADSFDWENFSCWIDPNGFRVCQGWLVADTNDRAKDIVLGEDIEGIAGDVFMDISDINEVTIKSSLIRIGPCAFKNSDLKSIKFDNLDSLKFIGHDAFAKTELTIFNCYSADVEVESGIFAYSKSLAEVVWPADTIPERTFLGCSSLSDLHHSAIKVDKLAFSRCTNLKKLNLEDVDYIGDYALSDMGDAVDLVLKDDAILGFRVLNNTIPKTEENYGNQMVGSWLYKSMFCSSPGSHRSSIALRSTVTGILPGAFDGVTLDELELDKECRVICPEALKGTGLKKLRNTIILKAVPAELFRECPDLQDIDVYDDTVLIDGYSMKRR